MVTAETETGTAIVIVMAMNSGLLSSASVETSGPSGVEWRVGIVKITRQVSSETGTAVALPALLRAETWNSASDHTCNDIVVPRYSPPVGRYCYFSPAGGLRPKDFPLPRRRVSRGWRGTILRLIWRLRFSAACSRSVCRISMYNQYRPSEKQKPDPKVARANKRLASRFYQLKTRHYLTGKYLQ